MQNQLLPTGNTARNTYRLMSGVQIIFEKAILPFYNSNLSVRVIGYTCTVQYTVWKYCWATDTSYLD